MVPLRRPSRQPLAKTQHIFQSVQDLVAQARANGYTIQNAEALPIAAQEVRAISAKIDVVYPQINEELAGAPEKINSDANETWIYKCELANASELNTLDTLLDAAAYEAFVSEETGH